MGFHKQLEVFEVMNFKIDRESLVYKSYKLENMAEQIKRGIILQKKYNQFILLYILKYFLFIFR